MHILMLASTVPASPDDHVPRFVLDQALAMAAADPGVRITILAPHNPASRALAWPRIEDAEGRVVQKRFRYAPTRLEDLTVGGIMATLARRRSRILVVPLLLLASARTARRAARRDRPDVIYAHWFTPQVLSAASASRRARIPFGFTTHATDAAVWWRFGRPGRNLVRRVTRRAAFMTAVSDQTASKLLAFFDEPERSALRDRLVTLPMGVDVPSHAPPPGDPHHVAVVARLVEKKGIHVLLEAWPAVVSAVPDATLTIGGDGPEGDRLRAGADALGIDVRFAGYVTGRKKAKTLADAGIVAVPSVVAGDGDQDGMPVALLEALALGRIVVASDRSGAQEVVSHRESGWIVPAGDADALAGAIVGAMTMADAARVAMVKAGREVAESHAWPAVARAHLRLLAP